MARFEGTNPAKLRELRTTQRELYKGIMVALPNVEEYQWLVDEILRLNEVMEDMNPGLSEGGRW